mgnify:CR=1 FL=1
MSDWYKDAIIYEVHVRDYTIKLTDKLADGSGGLQFVHRTRPLFPAEALHAFGDRAAGNQYHLAAVFAQRGDLQHPARQRAVVEPLSAVGHEAAADFYDEALRL